MKISKKDIEHLLLKIKQCSAKIGYELVLKSNKGYDVLSLESKLMHLNSLRSMIESCGCACKKNIIGREIKFCNKKVLLSKNNPLFLTNNTNAKAFQMADECCIDLCEVEAKLSSICINC